MICTGCVLCASFDAAEQQSVVREVLDHFEDAFLKDVKAKQIASRLYTRKVITEAVKTEIDRSSDNYTARDILFNYLKSSANEHTLKEFCDIVTSEQFEGDPVMHKLGKAMKAKLEAKLEAQG